MKYRGHIIHKTYGPQGVIEIVEDDTMRSLHFGTLARQSAMYLKDPVRLALSYTRAMMSFLLFTEAPRRALLIGLGGGSLAKFLFHHVPECHIDAVECYDTVAKLAHGYFALPEAPRLHVHIAEGAAFLRDTPHIYNVVLVDAFDQHGLARAVNNSLFLRDCWEHLTEDGALVINLWHKDHAAFMYTYRLLSNQFRGNLLRLPLEGKSNEVVLAFKHAAQITRLDKLRGQAKQLESHYHIEFPRLLRTLRRNNGAWYRRALA